MDNTIQSVLSKSHSILRAAGIRTARLDALVLFETVSGIARERLLARPNQAVSKDTKAKYDALIKLRAQRMPVQQLTHNQEFWGLNFYINKHVLSPRPESEIIVEYALSLRKGTSFTHLLDVGTGCGCLAIALAKEQPRWHITATDISSAALKVARRNAKDHDAEITFINSDLFNNMDSLSRDSLRVSPQKFDVITANLPYLKTDAKLTAEAAQEPAVALFGGDDGLDLYREFFAKVPRRVKPGGLVIIESDPWQQPGLIRIAKAAGFGLRAQDRFVLAFEKMEA